MHPRSRIVEFVSVLFCLTYGLIPATVSAQHSDAKDEIPIERCDRLPVVQVHVAGKEFAPKERASWTLSWTPVADLRRCFLRIKIEATVAPGHAIPKCLLAAVYDFATVKRYCELDALGDDELAGQLRQARK
jgi:hypothetical protein